MAFEDVIGKVMTWATATEALAALGAELSLQQSDAAGPPEIVSALQAVSAAGGITDLDQLPPPQRAMLLGLVRMYLHQALDVVEHPDRTPGWAFTEPAILDGWGRGSMMVPPLIAASHPDLADVGSFLDVGTGVGLLAVAAANVWPRASIVGIDPWEASLDRARSNVAQAGLDDRITLRREELQSIDDTDAYDCAWVPTFFLTEAAIEEAMPALLRAVRPRGWIVLGRFRTPADPLVAAIDNLRCTRGGGCVLEVKRALELLEHAGCTDVHVAPPTGPAPLELVLGQVPAAG